MESLDRAIEERERKLKRAQNFLRSMDFDDADAEMMAPFMLDSITANKVTRSMRMRYVARHQYGWFLAAIVLGSATLIGRSAWVAYDTNYYPYTVVASKNARFPENEHDSHCISGACVNPSNMSAANEQLNDLKDGDTTQILNNSGEILTVRREGARFIITVDKAK